MNRSKQIFGWLEMDFSTGGSILWIIDSFCFVLFLSRSNGLKLKMSWWICFLQTCIFSLHKMLIDGQGLFELLVYYCDVFISCLAPIHCRGSIDEQVMECYISPNLFPWGNKLIYVLDGLRVSTFSAISFF